MIDLPLKAATGFPLIVDRHNGQLGNGAVSPKGSHLTPFRKSGFQAPGKNNTPAPPPGKPGGVR